MVGGWRVVESDFSVNLELQAEQFKENSKTACAELDTAYRQVVLNYYLKGLYTSNCLF